CLSQLSTNGEQVIFSILFLIGDAALCVDGGSAAHNQVDSDEDCSVAVVSEGVALLKTLLASVNWAPVGCSVLHNIFAEFSSLLATKEWNAVVGKVTLAACFVLGGKMQALYKGCPVLFRHSTNEDYSIGIIQGFVEGNNEQAELVGIK